MRLRLIPLLLLLAIPARAQQPDIKYWVFFADKDAVAAKAAPISDRALHRRAIRAMDTPASLDLQVTPRYVEGVEAAGGRVAHRSRWLNAVSVWLSPDELEAVRRLPFVTGTRPVGQALPPEALVEPAFPRLEPAAPLAVASLDYGSSHRQLEIINAIAGIEAGLNGAGVILGIVDTGAGDLQHPATQHILDAGRLLDQRDFTGQPDDNNRHALAVLSVAAGYAPGRLIGPAYAADILLARTEYAPTETNQEEDNFVAGMEWMESRGADVVNISLGYSEFDPGQNSYTVDQMDGDTPITTQAADLAAQLGVTVVNSAGNAGSSAWGKITSPADGDSVIAVGAVGPNGILTSFSGRGPSADGRIKPDVSAMGSSVTVATRNGYSTGGNGTSFSAPMVAGIAAQLLQVNPTLQPMQIREILQRTASHHHEPNNGTGHGVIDAGAALALAATWTTDVESDTPSGSFSAEAFPNPSRTSPRLAVQLPEAGPVEITVFDLLGREVARSTLPGLSAGGHVLDLPTPPGANGWLGYRLTAGARVTTGSVILIR
ncbi:MAG: S8 family serine peptidase [Rhodothermales bacterium]|nr:S8 family serine peptidase [Rhodothermales bacterium]MBO6781223.1 S8 family serine peptidase [Rhodothermales bacterium]